MIRIKADTNFFYVDLRNLAVSSTLTGVLTGKFNQQIVSTALSYTSNDRAYKCNVSFFSGVDDGVYKLTIKNDSDVSIYSTRVLVDKNNVYTYTENNQTISVTQNEPS